MYNKKYYEEHKKQFREYGRKWYNNNKEEAREKARKYYKEHKETMYEYNQKWRDKNKKRFTNLCNESRRRRVERLREAGCTNAWSVVSKGEEPKYASNNNQES